MASTMRSALSRLMVVLRIKSAKPDRKRCSYAAHEVLFFGYGDTDEFAMKPVTSSKGRSLAGCPRTELT